MFDSLLTLLTALLLLQRFLLFYQLSAAYFFNCLYPIQTVTSICDLPVVIVLRQVFLCGSRHFN
jgi:hypothetical protein